MRIALAQMQNAGSVEQNLAGSISFIRKAVMNHADLILFPEVQLTEFFPQFPHQNVSEYLLTMDSPVITSFCNAARQYHIMVCPNLYLQIKGNTYDASLLIDQNGKILGIQKMVHIAQAPCFYEQDYYTPSEDGFHVYETPFGRIGIVVCFDRHYPESIRTEALMNADLILIPTVNTKTEPSEMFEWELRVQAFQNSVFIAMCNRVGKEGRMEFSGESMLCDPQGNLLLKADDQQQILYRDIDLSEASEIRRKKPYTSLRRPEFYK